MDPHYALPKRRPRRTKDAVADVTGTVNDPSPTAFSASDPPIPSGEHDVRYVPLVVIGGGIAGVSCAQELGKLGNKEILLITAGDAVKEVLPLAK
jgi:hypothetical protein